LEEKDETEKEGKGKGWDFDVLHEELQSFWG